MKMQNTDFRPHRLILAVLLFIGGIGLCLGQPGFASRAALLKKASPYLADEIDFLTANPEYEYDIPVIVRLSGSATRPSGLREEGKRSLSSIRGYSARLGSRALRRLVEDESVERISIDSVISASSRDGAPWSSPSLPAPTPPSNDYLATIGAEVANQAGYDGQGLTVAVFDSGIAPHPDLDYGNRIVFAVDFTSGEAVLSGHNEDGYGHGTHVAGLIAGDGRSSGGLYRGVAPAASLVDVKVLGDDGRGRVSDLIAAIEWVTEHREELDVSVANFSVSTPPFEPFYEDPLCEAVKNMALAGVTAVASAGNLGRLEGYPEIWGSVASPGTSPYAITVYPINHKGTSDLRDDSTTTYGSRGPSFQTSIWKPDVSAPGNRIPSLLAEGSLLASVRPQAVIGDRYIELSGSSMAAPLVTGLALLVLQAEPSLSPIGVKQLVLRGSKDYLETAHPFEIGRGVVDAVSTLSLLQRLERRPAGERFEVNHLVQRSLSGGTPVPWADEVFADLVFWRDAALWGDSVFWRDAALWGDSAFWRDAALWGDVSFWRDAALWGDSGFWRDAALWGDSAFWRDAALWGDVSFWRDAALWGDSGFWRDAALWGDSVFQRDAALWGDSSFWRDAALWGDDISGRDAALWGDSVSWRDAALWGDDISGRDAALWGDSSLEGD